MLTIAFEFAAILWMFISPLSDAVVAALVVCSIVWVVVRELRSKLGRPVEMPVNTLNKLTKWALCDGLFMSDGDTIGRDEERIRLTFDEYGRRAHAPIVRMVIERLARMGG